MGIDKRLGNVCTINGKDVYDLFNADLKEMRPVAGSIATDISKTTGASGLRTAAYDVQVCGIKMIFYVGGATKDECSLNTSNMISECQNCIIKVDNESFEYVAILTAFDFSETGVDFYNQVELTFSAVKRLPLVVMTFESGEGMFQNVGNVSSGVIFGITPNNDIETFTINDIVIKNLSSGHKFIIDGLNGKVTCNGINRFLDTNLIDFPKVSPGENIIYVSNNDVIVEVSYYPTFLV